MDIWKLPAAVARQVQETPQYLVEDGAAPEMHICRVAQRELREVWADHFTPGWRSRPLGENPGTPF